MRRFDLRDERGMTLVELLVATAAGVVVMMGITVSLIVVMRETSRVTTHVDANRRARLTMTEIIDQLHSACVAPQIAPIQAGSNGSAMVFLHQTGSAVAPTPIKSVIGLSGTTLTQSDYATTGGTAPKWTFATTPYATRTLMTKVKPVSASIPLFRYYAYSGSSISTTPLKEPLEVEPAENTVRVDVAFRVGSQATAPSGDAGAETEVQNSAVLRLTAPSYSATAAKKPCQ